MKHDNYKKAQPKAETKSDPPWETPIETMGVKLKFEGKKTQVRKKY